MPISVFLQCRQKSFIKSDFEKSQGTLLLACPPSTLDYSCFTLHYNDAFKKNQINKFYLMKADQIKDQVPALKIKCSFANSL